MQNLAQYDVIIVGLGPVGLLACNMFGKRGLKVLGVERRYIAYNFPRAMHLDDEIVRILQLVDLSEAMMPKLKPSWGLELVDKNRKVLARGNNKFPEGYDVSNFLFIQPELEQVLQDGCKRFKNVTLQYGVDITSFNQDEDMVEVFSKD